MGQGTSDVVWYGMLVVLAALLPPEAFGTVAASMAVVRVANLVMESGTAGAVVAARDLTLEEANQAQRLNVAVGAALTVLIAGSAGLLLPVVAEGGDPNVLRVLALAVVAGGFGVVPQALLRKSLDFRRVSLVTMVSAVTTAAAAVVAGLAGAGVWALVVRQLLYQGVVSALAAVAARPVRALLPRRPAGPRPGRGLFRAGPKHSSGFLVVGASALAAMTLDNLIVGAVTDARQLGFYSLAFTLGFAPLTQVSWRLGQVLFPAAAATADLATVGRRTARMMRVLTLVLWPLAGVAIAVAPAAIPSLFGSEWNPMVVPFQILIVVGLSHAVANVIAESLSGTGNIGFRAWCDAPWAALTLVGVGAAGAVGGIEAAAAVHLLTVGALIAAYVGFGSHRVGTTPAAIWRGLRGVLVPVLAQLAVTVTLLRLLDEENDWVAGIAASLAGLVVLIVLLAAAPSRPLADGRELLSLVRRRTPSGA